MNLNSQQINLEQTRSAICALANKGETNLPSAVHFHRLSSFLRFHVDRELLLAALDELDFLGEIYRLPNGYWYPSSSRCIAVGTVSLVASALPLQELIRQFGHSISMAGSMRLSNSEIPFLQQQSFRSWSRVPDDTQKWTEQKIALAESLLLPTSIDGALVQIHSNRTSNAKRMGLGTWCRITEILELSERELHLCRQKTIGNHYRYFFGEIADSIVIRESPVNSDDQRRLRFGLDVIKGRTLRVELRSTRDECSLDLWRRLPREETRVLNALTTQVEIDGHGISYMFHSMHLQTIARLLQPLGILLESPK